MSSPKASTVPVVELIDEAGTVRLRAGGSDLGLAFRSLRFETLTREQAVNAAQGVDDGTMLRFRRASPEAKQVLRERAIAYASDDDEIFVLDPPVVIHQSAHRRTQPPSSATSHPFSLKASRVSRWLLNHPEESYTVSGLARLTHLSEGAISQIARALHDRLLIDVSRDPDDSRARRIELREPGRLLDEWQRAWEARRVRELRWDIGSPGVPETLRRVQDATLSDPALRWAVGGVAGAAAIRRVVEPADVLLWVDEAQVGRWEDLLLPLNAHGGRGTLRLAPAPDIFMLDMAKERDGLRIADPAQLYLDTSREGERALEAAAALRETMHW